MDGEDNFIAGYLFDEGIDEPVVLVTDYNGDKELDVLSLVRDRQNSVKLIVNEKKEIVQEVSYSAYGETKIMNRGQKNPNLNNIFYYTSRELEPELGIYYYRARYYDPSVRRFLSEDPIGFESLDSNLYRYVENNPLTSNDPFGLWKWPKDVYKEAVDETKKRYPTGGHNDEADAFRHCMASCVMTQENGFTSSWALGEANEVRGDLLNNQPSCEKEMDRNNNAFGSFLGQSSGSCSSRCGSAASGGLLKTLR